MIERSEQPDRPLLAALEHLGLHRTDAIAEMLGVSDRTVRRRIDSLIKTGTIRVVAVPNPVACGFGAWTKIGIRVLPEHLSRVARMLVGHPSVYFAAYSLGRFDIVIALLLDSNRALAHFVNTELSAIDGVVDVEPWLMVVPRKYHQFSWPAPAFERNGEWWSPYREVATNTRSYELDEKQRKILSVLRENGLIRPAALASQIGLGESTVRKSLKDMQRRGLYQLAVVLNPEVLRDDVWATIGIKAKKTDVHAVIDRLSSHSAAYLCTVTLGRFDIIVGTRFPSTGELNHFVTGILPSVRGITGVETFVHDKPLKYHNVQWPNLLDGSTTYQLKGNCQ